MNQPKLETRPQSDNTRLIPLTQGQFAIVDENDYAWLTQWKWYAIWNNKTRSFYAARTTSAANGQKAYSISMHRQILCLAHGDKRLGDHIRSGDTLNNRRSNLRIADRFQNQHNRRARRDSTSGYKGITPFQGKWIVELRSYGKRIYVGYFSTLEIARKEYLEAARYYHGDFATSGSRRK